MKVLIGTNHFQALAGSETVALETAEYLRSLGHDCDIAANFVGQPMRKLAIRAGARVLVASDRINGLDYDLLWFQHQVGPVLRYERSATMAPRTLFAFAHLGAFANLAAPGVFLESIAADRIYANSPETAEGLRQYELDPGATHVFWNAAPRAFWNAARTRRALRTITAVSNHMPAELLGAFGLLESRGYIVHHIGEAGMPQRVTPELINAADVVVTIGKTAQFALAGRCPVYVYDRFGGPGYLNAENFERAAWFNFSGRCCGRKLAVEQIAAGIVTGFDAAVSYAVALDEKTLYRFRLEPFLDDLLDAIAGAPDNAARLDVLAANRGALARERRLCTALGIFYRQARHVRKTLR